jgi:hypothetical protein
MQMLKALIAAAFLVAAPLAAQEGGSWDGLVKVRSERADALFLLPGVDFSVNTKVKFDPTEDFEDMFPDWARAAVRGLETLKAHPPVSPAAGSRP